MCPRTILLLSILSGALGSPAFAGSTINPNAPAQGSTLSSSVVRGNFAAAYNDVNNILGMFSGTSAPGAPTIGQDWLDTTSTPAVWKKRYNSGWGTIGSFNLTTGVFIPGFLALSQSANTVFSGPASGAAAAPAFRLLVGADLPLPSLTTLGGVQAKAAVTSNWLRSLGTDGILTASQPAFSDLSGSIACGQLPALTGDVTSSAGSCATTLVTAQPGAHTWALGQTFSAAMTYGGVTLANSVTGTGSMVLSVSPTITGHMTVEGVTASGATGTGNFVFATAPTVSALTITGSLTATGLVTNAALATMATNTIKGNATSGSASPTDLAIGSCSAASSALSWTTNTGFGCNTSITAAIAPAGTLTGTTLAANVVTSSLTSVGTLTGGATGAGFTIALSTSTLTGSLPLSNIAAIADNTALGNVSGGSAAPIALSKTQLTTLVNAFTTTLSGAVPAPGSVTGAVLSDDGTWISVGGTGTVTSITCATTLTCTASNPIVGAGTIALNLGNANSWTAVQTFDNSTIRLLGSSTGYTTFASANAGASNYTITVPAITSTLATLGGAGQVLSGGATVTSLSQSTGSITVDCGARPLQYITNGGAYTITAPAADGSCFLFVTNNGSAGATTFSGFTVGSNTGAALTTTNGNKFTINVWRINGTSGYTVFAHQ